MTAGQDARPPLDRARLAAPPGLPGLTVEVLDEVPSTNAVVAERARLGADAGLVVVAEHQSAGRGRLDRSWEAPAGTALTFSVLLRPRTPARTWPWLPLLTGYAVAGALRSGGFEADVKWPNDVLIGERKVAGILVERVEASPGPAAVVGVGLNTSMADHELPVPHATSLAIESGRPPDRTGVLLDVLAAMEATYEEWQAADEPAAARLAASYAEACVTVGRQVRVDLPGGSVLEGQATGIDAGGQLVVGTPEGERRVGAGDVVHVRAVE